MEVINKYLNFATRNNKQTFLEIEPQAATVTVSRTVFMDKYNYLETVKSDVMDHIKWNDIKVTTSNRDELESSLYDELFVSDSVTGNASGSYFCNAWKAEEAICHNLDLLAEACEEFGSMDVLKDGAEACDVTIRCYLLSQAISEALDELEEDDEDEDSDV